MKSDEDFNYIRDAILCQNFHSLGLLFGIKPSFISTINNSNNTDGKSAKLREQMETLNTTLIPKPKISYSESLCICLYIWRQKKPVTNLI